MLYKLIMACIFFGLSHSVFAKEAFHEFGVVLLQPEEIIHPRVPDVSSFNDYINAIEKAISDSIKQNPEFSPASGLIVIAVKPGKKSKIWLDFRPQLKNPDAAIIQIAAKSVPAFEAKGGVVLFAIRVGLWGGEKPNYLPPNPEEWKVVVKNAGHPLELGALVEKIWRD